MISRYPYCHSTATSLMSRDMNFISRFSASRVPILSPTLPFIYGMSHDVTSSPTILLPPLPEGFFLLIPSIWWRCSGPGFPEGFLARAEVVNRHFRYNHKGKNSRIDREVTYTKKILLLRESGSSSRGIKWYKREISSGYFA